MQAIQTRMRYVAVTHMSYALCARIFTQNVLAFIT